MRLRRLLIMALAVRLLWPTPAAHANSDGESGITTTWSCQTYTGIRAQNSVGHYHNGLNLPSNFAYNNSDSYNYSCGSNWYHSNHEAAYWWSTNPANGPEHLCVYVSVSGYVWQHTSTYIDNLDIEYDPNCANDEWYATSSNHYLSMDGTNLYQSLIGVTSGWWKLNINS
jgi:hypothetical protein